MLPLLLMLLLWTQCILIRTTAMAKTTMCVGVYGVEEYTQKPMTDWLCVCLWRNSYVIFFCCLEWQTFAYIATNVWLCLHAGHGLGLGLCWAQAPYDSRLNSLYVCLCVYICVRVRPYLAASANTLSTMVYIPWHDQQTSITCCRAALISRSTLF